MDIGRTLVFLTEELSLTSEFSVISLQGYLVNWDVQRKVWDHLFGKEMFKVYFVLYFVHSDLLFANV